MAWWLSCSTSSVLDPPFTYLGLSLALLGSYPYLAGRTSVSRIIPRLDHFAYSGPTPRLRSPNLSIAACSPKSLSHPRHISTGSFALPPPPTFPRRYPLIPSSLHSCATLSLSPTINNILNVRRWVEKSTLDLGSENITFLRISAGWHPMSDLYR